MKRVTNPELERKVLNHLADLYNIKEVREPNHLSSYVYCRTRTFLDQQQAAEPTDEEVMLFSLGYALQDVLTPKDATAPLINKYGIIYRPDMILTGRLNEIKTTRKSAKNHFNDEALPETWLEYMLGGCYMMDSKVYDLIVLYLMGNYAPPMPQIYADTFTFTQAEIEDNWQIIMNRKYVLDTALESKKIPTPYEHCNLWECQYCRHSLVCQTVIDMEGGN